LRESSLSAETGYPLAVIRALSLLVTALLTASCAKAPRVVSPVHGAADVWSSMRHIIPLPRTVEPANGAFTLTAETPIVVAPGDERAAWIATYLAEIIGLAAAPEPPRVVVQDPPAARGAIALELDRSIAGAEAYELITSADGVRIRAGQAAGLFHGVQSFRQTLPPFVEFAAVRPDASRPVLAAAGRLVDEPRFPWRGAMLDVARHFLSVDEVKRYVDLMAIYKLNRLHLHLADDQGWRIEIRSWPNLAVHGGSSEVGGGAGGFYTQAQYADLVRYAAERFITIVPEIDMPGHTNAALASYPELNCDGVAPPLYTGIQVGFSALCLDKEITYTFIDDVIREIAAITPGPWFHSGGDEVKTVSPAQYVRFIERVQTIVQSHGKLTIGWDEISAATLHPTSIVQHWQPKVPPATAAAKGARLILSIANRTYLDMKYDSTTPLGLSWAGLISVRASYDWEPIQLAAPTPESAILGVEAPLWAETVKGIRDVEFLAFPRLVAIAEVGWSPGEGRNWESFSERLAAHGPRLAALGVNFHRSPEVPWKR
jgi:hexosaminidase